jgi:peptidoglycan/xylan/chitin deacetylase (PgdA/CDA1 family)
MRRVVQWYRRRFSSRAVILLYHRVIELASDPYLLAVSPTHFAEHLAVLRKYAQPISLLELVNGLRRGRVPRRAVIITFDDGYFDNLVYAKPLLEQHEIPATVFVTPFSALANSEFWWDTLQKILLGVGSLPESLRLMLHGVAYEWHLNAAADYTWQDYARDASWNYGRKDDPTPRHTIFRSLHQLLKYLEEEERRQALRDLAAWAGVDTSVRTTDRLLSDAETIQLAEGGLIEVGAHTMTHPVLSALPVTKQRQEIGQSKRDLEQLLGHRVTSFAYPHGLNADYTQETVKLVRESGFDCACAAWPGTIRSDIDTHQLPRFIVRNKNGEAFAEELSMLLEG